MKRSFVVWHEWCFYIYLIRARIQGNQKNKKVLKTERGLCFKYRQKRNQEWIVWEGGWFVVMYFKRKAHNRIRVSFVIKLKCLLLTEQAWPRLYVFKNATKRLYLQKCSCKLVVYSRKHKLFTYFIYKIKQMNKSLIKKDLFEKYLF